MDNYLKENEAICIWCGEKFVIGETGNELGSIRHKEVKRGRYNIRILK